MPWRNFLLFVHIGGAIMFFGPTFTFPLVGVVAQKHNGDPKTLLRLQEMVVKFLVIPGDYLMPLSGTLLILQSKGAWDPFIKQNRWLLASLILYTILYLIANIVQIPAMKKARAMADAGQFGPEFGAVMQKQGKFGPVLGILTLTIMVLMIVKPGSGFIHP